MDRKDIDTMWQKAMNASIAERDQFTRYNFAKLVAEECAKVCDARYMGDNNREDMEARRCAAAIRSLYK